jgi:hypothetical protein
MLLLFLERFNVEKGQQEEPVIIAFTELSYLFAEFSAIEWQRNKEHESLKLEVEVQEQHAHQAEYCDCGIEVHFSEAAEAFPCFLGEHTFYEIGVHGGRVLDNVWSNDGQCNQDECHVVIRMFWKYRFTVYCLGLLSLPIQQVCEVQIGVKVESVHAQSTKIHNYRNPTIVYLLGRLRVSSAPPDLHISHHPAR